MKDKLKRDTNSFATYFPILPFIHFPLNAPMSELLELGSKDFGTIFLKNLTLKPKSIFKSHHCFRNYGNAKFGRDRGFN